MATNVIAEWRARRRYSESDAAQILDCTVAQYRDIENGNGNLQWAAVRDIERRLGIRYSQFAGKVRQI